MEGSDFFLGEVSDDHLLARLHFAVSFRAAEWSGLWWKTALLQFSYFGFKSLPS